MKTTIETLSTSKMTFPKITVCPPKNTFTALNYDLFVYENKTLDTDTRNELKKYAVELLIESLHSTIMEQLQLLQDNERYFNWYNGFSRVNVPFYRDSATSVGSYLVNKEESYATLGSISTMHFGEKFNALKMRKDVFYRIFIFSPQMSNPNVTFHLEVEKVQLKELLNGYDNFEIRIDSSTAKVTEGKFIKQFSPPGYYEILLSRKMDSSEARKLKLSHMPGFNVTWYHTSNDVLENKAYYIDYQNENR